jgi:hypothetical protein
MSIKINKSHIGSNITWSIEPKCRCGKFREYVDNGLIFSSNYSVIEYNIFYIMLLDAYGDLVSKTGVEISHCPWCGDHIQGFKNMQG